MQTFLIVLFCSLAASIPAEDQIRLVRYGTNVTEQPSPALTTNVIRMLQSCCYYSTAYAVKATTWPELEYSDSFVLLTFATPKRLKVTIYTSDPAVTNIQQLKIHLSKGTPEVKSIDQVLVPLPERAFPLHIFARSGTNVSSFCKWDPIALGMLASEPALHLSQLYRSFVGYPAF